MQPQDQPRTGRSVVTAAQSNLLASKKLLAMVRVTSISPSRAVCSPAGSPVLASGSQSALVRIGADFFQWNPDSLHQPPAGLFTQYRTACSIACRRRPHGDQLLHRAKNLSVWPRCAGGRRSADQGWQDRRPLAHATPISGPRRPAALRASGPGHVDRIRELAGVWPVERLARNAKRFTDVADKWIGGRVVLNPVNTTRPRFADIGPARFTTAWFASIFMSVQRRRCRFASASVRKPPLS